MKKLIAWLLAMMLMMGCSFAEMAVPEKAIPLPMDGKIDIDLDSDGEAEEVQLRMEYIDDETYLRIIIEGTDGAMNIYDTWIMYPETCYALDMNSDGILEILLTGDLQSDDYCTWCLNYDLENGIRSIKFADANRGINTGEYLEEGYGKIMEISGNTITLRGSQDVLGTWMADRTFSLTNGVFEFADDGLWIMQDITGDEDIWEYYCLTPIKEVPVTFEDGSEGTLAEGEKFVISYTDKTSVAGFTTQDGKKGSITLTENTEEGWGHKIAGVADYEYFEYIPYAD